MTGAAQVYTAEDQVAGLLERGGVVDFHGSLFDLPAERRFGDLAGVERYLAALRVLPGGYGLVPPVRLRRSRAKVRATWQAPDTISLPGTEQWALRESVILHEYSHHVTFHTGRGSQHDRAFCEVLVELTGRALGPEVATILLATLTETGAYG